MRTRRPDADSERRLDELRRQADLNGRVDAKGVRPAGSPLPAPSAETGYYGLPLLKPPVWTWEIPTYFFVGGAAGASAVIGFAAHLTDGSPKLIRDARWIAAIGASVSAPLLIADLGRPERFLNMLRVFKLQSPMSVGAWIVAAFGGASTAAILFRGRLADAAAAASAIAGLGMATYTGVLVGATTIPVWRKHVALLPIHFGSSAVASAASLLELRGNHDAALHYLALTAAACETLAGAAIESRRDVESEPLRQGPTGVTTRIGGLFSGPIPLILRLFGRRSKRLRRAAAASSLLGSLITRFAWVEAGRASSRDPRPALNLEP